MADDITDRVLDLAFEQEVVGSLQDLASTGASAEWLTGFLKRASSRDVVPWQVGEAIAETVLENFHDVIFPWNSSRDERNPRASLPGADLVGLSADPSGYRLVFGEVKSSADASSPPAVVTGKSGLDRQLEAVIDNDDLHFTLIKWLSARVDEFGMDSAFTEALASFVETKGSSVRFVGVLVRDTPARESDVSSRGRALGSRVSHPGSVELHALYMPKPMTEWTEWVVA